MKQFEIRVIAETSAGLLGIEVEEAGKLIYAEDWTEWIGSSFKRHIRDFVTIVESMSEINGNEDLGDRDDDGNPIPLLYPDNPDSTTYVLATFDVENRWKFAEPRPDCLAWEFIKANLSRFGCDSGNFQVWEAINEPGL